MKLREYIAKNLDKLKEAEEERVREIEEWAIERPKEVARYLYYLETKRLRGL